MKKMALKFLAMFSFVILGCLNVFAVARPMTSAEQDVFVADLQRWINDYAARKYDPLVGKLSPKSLAAEVFADVEGWSTFARIIDLSYGFGEGVPWKDDKRTATGTFGEALQTYHEYVSKYKPLSCRGFASYVFQELRTRGFACKYAKITFNPMLNNPAYIDAMLQARKMKKNPENIEKIRKIIKKTHPSEPYDVVVYSTDDGTFVCDFTQAIVATLKYRYGDSRAKEDARLINHGLADMARFMRYPEKEYVRIYLDVENSLVNFSPDRSYGAIADEPCQFLDVDAHPELLTKPACEVYDHYRPLEDYERINLLGIAGGK